MIQYRNANFEDLPGISDLQQRYHVSTIPEDEKADGFVTTLFSDDQFRALITQEQGLAIACADAQIIGYAMAASWDFWSAWPLFQHMIADLPKTQYLGQTLSTENSYQYGPICLDKAWRSKGVFENLFEFSRLQMAERFPIMITFINQINPRSYAAHTRKVGMELIKTFDFNSNHYYELGYDMSRSVPSATLPKSN